MHFVLFVNRTRPVKTEAMSERSSSVLHRQQGRVLNINWFEPPARCVFFLPGLKLHRNLQSMQHLSKSRLEQAGISTNNVEATSRRHDVPSRSKDNYQSEGEYE